MVIFIISLLIASLLPGTQPNLQAAQADTARKNDVARLSSVVLMYQANTRGQLPTAEELSTADLEQITVIASEGQPTTDKAVYTAGQDCDGHASSRAYAITIKLASGSSYCDGS